jgi:hypothetical protein
MTRIDSNVARTVGTRPKAIKRTTQRLLTLVFIAGLAGYGIVLAFTPRARNWGFSERPSVVDPIENSRSAGAAPAAPPPESVEAVVLTLHPKGFEPDSIARAAGRFILGVSNRSGVGQISLRLDRENGVSLFNAQISRNKPQWGEVFDLSPGTYLFREASHPKWVCRVTITDSEK